MSIDMRNVATNAFFLLLLTTNSLFVAKADTGSSGLRGDNMSASAMNRALLSQQSDEYTYDEKGCPLTDPAYTCPMMYSPMTCAREGKPTCEYGNACSAEGAGYVTDSECTPEVIVESQEHVCPTPKTTQKICPNTSSPLICSTDSNHDCFYDNDCYATQAGYNVETDCKSAHPPCPKPSKKLVGCFTSGRPLICSDDFFKGCYYDNHCYAKSAGFSVRKECKSA